MSNDKIQMMNEQRTKARVIFGDTHPSPESIPDGENYKGLSSPVKGEDKSGGDDRMTPSPPPSPSRGEGVTVLEELAVAHSDDPVRHGRSILAVGDEDDGLPVAVPQSP